MSTPDIMIDIETLGTGDHAAIVQIGAVRFNRLTGAQGETFRSNIDWGCEHFGNIEPDTMRWWLEQGATVRAQVFSQLGSVSLARALALLDKWVADSGPVETIWACPPNFDHRLIRQACERTGVPYRFSFFKERDMRTVREEFGRPADYPGFDGLKHDALADAAHQAKWLCATIKRIRSLCWIPEKDPTD